MTEPTARPSAASGSGSASSYSRRRRSGRCGDGRRAARRPPAAGGRAAAPRSAWPSTRACAPDRGAGRGAPRRAGRTGRRGGAAARRVPRARRRARRPRRGGRRSRWRGRGRSSRRSRGGRRPRGAGVEALLGEQVGFGDAVVPAGQPVEDPPVRQGAARHRLDVAEVRAAQSVTDGGGRPSAVGGLQGDESTPGAHQGGARAQQFLQRGVERVPARTRRSVSSWRVVRSETQPARRSWSSAPGAWWGCGAADGAVPVAGATVCAGAGTVESIPATFGGCGAFMASGFPTGTYCSKASQTPMSFCVAGSVSTCTRTRKEMSSIVLLGFLVSV